MGVGCRFVGTVVHVGIDMEFLSVVLDVTMRAEPRVCGR